MRLVLDSCVALKWVLPEADSATALRLRDDARAGRHDLLAPDILSVEVAHALARAERRGLIPTGLAAPYLASVMTVPVALSSYLPLLDRALAIASSARIGVYDCLYVALAEQDGCPLVTADDRLVRTLSAQFPFIVPLASLP